MRSILHVPWLVAFRVGAALFLGAVAPFICFHAVASTDAPHGPHLVFLEPAHNEAGHVHLHAPEGSPPTPGVNARPVTPSGHLLLVTGLLVACATAWLRLIGLTLLRRVPAFHPFTIIPLYLPQVDPPPRPA